MTDYATLAQVKSRLSSDQLRMSNTWDDTISGIITNVSRALDRAIGQARGIRVPYSIVADAEASARRFTARYGAPYLTIDDAVEITSVTEAGQLLVLDTDYVTDPLQGVPTTGLAKLGNGRWTRERGSTVVVAKWGFAVDVPEDVTEQTIIESIRGYLGAKAGYDDKIGMTPLGQVVTSPAWTASTWALISDYSEGAGFLRASAG